MFETLRYQKRAISRQEAEEILRKGEYGILSTTGADGYPYGVPVSYVYLDGRIGFHCAPAAGHKLHNLKENDRVCFTVVGDTQVLPAQFSTRYESVILFGRAIEAGEEKRRILEGLIEKYSAEHLEAGKAYIERFLASTGAYLIEIEYMTGKACRKED